MTTATTVRKAPQGEYVKRKVDAKTVYIRQDYDRATKTFCLQDTADMNRCIYLKPGAVVFVGFDY
jgi:hypothetical protein